MELQHPPEKDLHTKVDRLITMMRAALDSHHILREGQQLALESHAMLQEGQRRLEGSADRVEGSQLTIRQRITTILKKTDQILGVTTRTHNLVRNFKEGHVTALLRGLFLDEWMVLYLYILVHPFVPATAELFASAWQYVLFAQRLWFLPGDLRSGALIQFSFSGLLLCYMTSPWKALFLLHWLNHSALELRGSAMYSVAFPGVSLLLPQIDLTPYDTCAAIPVSPLLLSCVARATFFALLNLAHAIGRCLAVPGLLFQLGQILDLEMEVLRMLWAGVCWVLNLLLWRTVVKAQRWACGLEWNLGRWIGTVRPFSALCPVAGPGDLGAGGLGGRDEL